MSHPQLGHDYHETTVESKGYEKKKNRRLSSSQLKKYSHKLMGEMGVTTKSKHEALKRAKK